MNYDQVNYETVTHGLQMRELKDSEVFEYGCDDTVTSAALFRFFEVFTKYEDSFNAYVKVDLPAQYVLAEAFLNGLKFDMKRLEELQEENSHMYKELLCNIEEFLVDLQWETVEQPTVTLAMLKSGVIPEGKTIIHKWPGCEFVEAKEISPVEIKRLYKIYSGLDLKTMVRDITKIKAMIPDFKFDTLEEMNALARSKFIATPEINLRSPKQLGELLYTALGYPVRLRNKVTDKQRAEGRREGNASTDDDAFAHAIANDATEEQKVFLKNILGAKSCLTEESLFFSPYKQMPHWEDRLVHPQSGQSLAKTGRANASFPNISQVSKISKVREVYVPSVEGNIWISLDFSGQEILHCAWQSQDENLLSCFRGEKRDVHSLCSVGIWNKKHDTPITYEEFNTARKDKSHPLHTEAKELRNRRGKRTVFLKQYGGTAVTLAVQLLVPESEAQEMLDAYDVMFPGINAWQQRKEEEYKRLGYAVSPMGRRKHLELAGDWHDKHEIRSAINMPIQCGSGEQVKLVFGELWRQKTLDKYNAIFLFSVHDEINIEASKDVAVDLIREVHKIMTQPFTDFDVDIQSSIEVGRNFGTLSEVSVEFDEEKLRKALEKL
jgi:DNA polymerase I-like protein with 3'-5' exonuclease and polymerase domains